MFYSKTYLRFVCNFKIQEFKTKKQKLIQFFKTLTLAIVFF